MTRMPLILPRYPHEPRDGELAPPRGGSRVRFVRRVPLEFGSAAAGAETCSWRVCVHHGRRSRAAAQYTWLGLWRGRWRDGVRDDLRGAWSLGTIAAASYGAVCRAGELDGGMIGGGRASGFSGGFSLPGGRVEPGGWSRGCATRRKRWARSSPGSCGTRR